MSVCHSCNNNNSTTKSIKRSTPTVPAAQGPRPSSRASVPTTFTPITVVRPSRQVKAGRAR